jgi:hypothetical protein
MANKHDVPARRPLPQSLTRLLDDPLISFPDLAGPRRPADDADYLAMLDQLDARLEHFQRLLAIIATQSVGPQPGKKRRKSRRR